MLVEGGHDVVLRWWVHEVEVEEVLDAEVLEEEHDVGEVGALNLGDGGLHEFLAELAVGVESEVESWSSTSCASGALVCVGARDGCYVEAVHSEFGVEDFNFAVSAVDDIFDSIHGKTRLRHIRRNDTLPNPLGRRLEYLRLQIRRQLRVHRQHQQRLRILPQLLHLLRQHGARPLDILLPRHKDEHVPRRTVEVQLYRLLDRRHDIILLHRFREVGFNGEGPSGYAKDRHAPEELAEHVRAERRAGDDELEVRSSLDDFPQHAEEHIGVEGALVRLIHDDRAVGVEVLVPQALPQQHPVRHVLDPRIVRRLILEPDRVAYRPPPARPSFSLPDRAPFPHVSPRPPPPSPPLHAWRRSSPATLLGWVHPISIPSRHYPDSRRYWVSWVVLPDPVSPTTMTTLFSRTTDSSSSRTVNAGR